MQLVSLLRWIASVNKETSFAVLVCCHVNQVALFNDSFIADVPGLTAIDQVILRKHGKNHLVMPNNTRIKDIENGVSTT